MTHHTSIAAERRNVCVTGVARTDDVQTDVGLASVADPVPREGPGGAAPNLVCTQLLEQRAFVHCRSLRAVRVGVGGRDGVVGIVKDSRGSRLAEGPVDGLLVGANVQIEVDATVDGQSGLVLDVCHQDGFGNGRECRGRVKWAGDEGPVLHQADGFAQAGGLVQRHGCANKIVLEAKEVRNTDVVKTRNIGCRTRQQAIEVGLQRLLSGGRKEAIVLHSR